MASGSLGAEEEPREKCRWSENSKVYTRRVYRGNKNNPNCSTTTTTTTTDAATTTAGKNQAKENNDDNSNKNNNNNDDSCGNDNRVANGTIENKGNEKENENIPQKSSSPKVATEEANSSQPQQDSCRLETGSEDSSSLNRPLAPIPNGRDGNLANGSVRPVETREDDRVNISSVSGSKTKREVRELKRKLVNELDQVRKMAKQLEAKEIQLSGYSSSEVGVGIGGVVDANSPRGLQFPVNGGGVRQNSEMGSVGFNNLRPFRQLSVSVMEYNHGVGEIVEKEKRTPKANQYYRNSEFLLGKEKLPPAESNKKSKSSGGKKHSSGEFDYGFGIDKKFFKKCSNLLQKLMKHKHGWVFNQPVDVKSLGLHDYFDIIKHPMDLGTVKTRLTKNWYKTPREFAEDVRVTFHNAMTYNPEGQDVHIMARDLLRIFEDKWPDIETEYDRKLRYEMIRDLPTPTSRKTYAPAHVPAPMPLTPALLRSPPPFQDARNLKRSQSMPNPTYSRAKPSYPAARTPAPKKPKAKDPHKRDMTFEEKQRLSTNLQSLPSEKLDAIVQIIKKRNSALSQHDEEIEVDIDSVDAETLWELDRFVTNYKKSLSKHKRKAELALQARAVVGQAVQETIPAPSNIEAPNETRAAEGNINPSPHTQQEKHSDNASGSSSSSSSSSDSGSSSSDSDTDSSSGSGSDGGQ